MIKPERLKKGDTVAIVSLSWGGLGDEQFIHKFDIAKKRLEEEFGLNVKVMPHALKGSKFVLEHPELRAQDLMEAFKDKDVNAIICAVGGDDTIRTLPYIDFDVIKKNPKIFMGYSDSTINHFMMHKAGLISYYGPCIMVEFGEYVKMFDYTKEAIVNILFNDSTNLEIKPSPKWTKQYIPWDIKNINLSKKLIDDPYGYELLNGNGVVSGNVLGGCIEVFPMAYNTVIWPSDWDNKILLVETSEEKPEPEYFKKLLEDLGNMGIFNKVKGMIVGKPYEGVYYEEYKDVIKEVINKYNRELPVLYNINIGHATPIGIIPLGVDIEVNYDEKKIKILESATK